jgi:hypothetical protein
MTPDLMTTETRSLTPIEDEQFAVLPWNELFPRMRGAVEYATKAAAHAIQTDRYRAEGGYESVEELLRAVVGVGTSGFYKRLKVYGIEPPTRGTYASSKPANSTKWNSSPTLPATMDDEGDPPEHTIDVPFEVVAPEGELLEQPQPPEVPPAISNGQDRRAVREDERQAATAAAATVRDRGGGSFPTGAASTARQLQRVRHGLREVRAPQGERDESDANALDRGK